MDSYKIILIFYLFLIYWFIIVFLDRRGLLKRYNISSYGPILQIRAVRGERLLERLGTVRRFWRAYANIGTVLMIMAMAFMFFLVINGAFTTFMVRPEPTELNEPRNWLLIPGLNTFIPMCAWIGFVVAMIVHELSHGILSIVERIKVKSMGLLLLVVPIGAFTEPDTEQLFGTPKGTGDKKVASAHERTRILSAGVMGNFVIAILAFLIFFGILFSIQPVGENVLYVYNVANGSPAAEYGIEPRSFITAMDGEGRVSVEELNNRLEKGKAVSLTILDRNGDKKAIVVRGEANEGVTVVFVEKGKPAAKAGIKEGMTIIKMDNRSIRSYEDFLSFMNDTVAGEEIKVWTKRGEVFEIKLEESPYYANRGYLGVGVANCALGMTVLEFPTRTYLEYLRDIPRMLFKSPASLLLLMSLPVLPLSMGGFSTFNPLLSHLYTPVGVASVFGAGIFSIADVLFWIAWINFYVGLFNCLPMYPLDGYYVFKEVLNPMLRMGIKEEAKKELVLKTIAIITAVIIFLSIVFMLVAPFVFELL